MDMLDSYRDFSGRLSQSLWTSLKPIAISYISWQRPLRPQFHRVDLAPSPAPLRCAELRSDPNVKLQNERASTIRLPPQDQADTRHAALITECFHRLR